MGSNIISRVGPIYTNKINADELKKAACCNLSESFQTNPSVDVTYSDAVSGAKQIQLLGLGGAYSQMLTENIPNLGGLASTYGLEYIPGSWMESIQISKGAAAVINGYESTTGQIDVEYKKPENSEKFYLSLFANDKGDFEENANSAIKINKKLSTIFLIHAQNNFMKIDQNHDGFLDMPLVNQYDFLNNWVYVSPKNFITHFGFQVLDEDRQGGQTNFNIHQQRDTLNPYGIDIKTKRYQINFKEGYMFKKPGTSIGFVSNATYHQQNSFFGINNYSGEQKSFYGNLIYQSFIGNTNHKFSTGASLVYNDYAEKLNDSAFKSKEIVPGIYFQYTYSYLDKFVLIAGIRADYQNIYGLFYTPRVHLKYNINKNTIIRASIGEGYRTPHIIAENSYVLASSRKIIIAPDLKQEQAWNYGINISKFFTINKHEMNINAEVYRTYFINQVIVDMDQNVSQIKFYNLQGKAFANCFQIDLRYEPIDRLDVLLAMRWNDVKTTIDNELMKKPMVNRYKGLINLGYKTRLKKWQFDFTAQFNGDSRLPSTNMNPVEYERANNSPAYTILNAQIKKVFKKWEIYVGVENITNFTQHNPIIAASEPYSQFFDASMVWGPIVGRKIYCGLRYSIE